MNPVDLCNLFYSSHFLPIGYFSCGELRYRCAPLPEDVPLFYRIYPLLNAQKQNPAVVSLPDAGFYGRVRACSGEEFLIGPILSARITGASASAFMQSNAIPIRYKSEVATFLNALPKVSYNQFLNLLAFIHGILNGEAIDITSHFHITENLRPHAVVSKPERPVHGTYAFEERMLDLVRQGAVERLDAFLMDSTRYQSFSEGTLADNPLRQARNLFIGLVASVGKHAAIPGGMEVGEAYDLIDLYTQECEKTLSIHALKALQYEMLLDFTQRVAKSKLPDGVSPEVYACVRYLQSHTNDHIELDAVAKHIGKSRAYITRKFREEMGASIGQYAMQCKLTDAQDLLRHSDWTIVEISDYLGFSSQSHFQAAFKRATGVTPYAFRTRKRND